MTLPVRASFRVTRFAVRTGLTFSLRALAVVSDAVTEVTGRGGDSDSSWPAPKPPASDAENAGPSPSAPTSVATSPPAWTDDPPSPLVEEPAHVSEEPVLVEEFAEPGAEEGAGAEVRVDEPWNGYAHMSARDITARLGDASPAELAAIQLYESTHKQRETVISAVERELRSKTAPGG